MTQTPPPSSDEQSSLDSLFWEEVIRRSPTGWGLLTLPEDLDKLPPRPAKFPKYLD
jgi:hypothetical protein